MKRFALIFSVVLIFIFLQACQQEPIEGPTSNSAPTLPPPATFIMPFNGFEDADTSDFVSFEDEIKNRNVPSSFRNWFYAATNLVVWNGFVGLISAVPVAAFGEAFNHNPVSIGDGVYQWSYDVTVAGQTYIAKLNGQFTTDGGTQWEMRIAQVGGFAEFTWYTGTVSRDGNTASWILNHPADNPAPALQIDYDEAESDDTFFIRYTNIIADDPENGHYIEYRTQPSESFNRAYDVFRGDSDFLEIEWDIPSEAGRVRNEPHFGNNDWQCWSSEKRDIDC